MVAAEGNGSGGCAACVSPVAQVIRGRWFMLFASFLIMTAAGATYLFGVYSKDVKSALGYDQTTLNLLGFAKDLGANVGVISGLLAEVAPTWTVLLLGSALNFAGYFMLWLAVTAKIPRPRLWHMCAYICMGANSQNFANTGALVACVQNFPDSRGVVLGLLKGFVGLSGAILTQIYLALYDHDSKSLILLLAWLPAAVSVIFVYTIRTLDASTRRSHHAGDDFRVMYRFLYASIILALFLMAVTIAQKLADFPRAAYAACATAVCALLFLPLAIAAREELAPQRNPIVESIPPVSPQIKSGEAREEPSGRRGRPRRGEDHTILEALTSADMAILFVATFCGLGTSLTAVDNLGQIGESQGYPSRAVSTFVSLVSIWNYFGRVSAGFVSEALLARRGVARPLVMAAALVLSAAGQLMIAFPAPGAVYAASVIIGFSFGAQLPLVFAVISELFGLRHFSTLFNCGQLASPLGSYVLSVQVTGRLYDREARRMGAGEGGEVICRGRRCYRTAFVILAGVTVFGAAAAAVLGRRTREFYRGDVYGRFRQGNEVREKAAEMGGDGGAAATSSA